MKALTLLTAVITGTLALTAVNYDELRNVSPEVMAGLNDRFISGDTTLTTAEVSTVYYSTVFSPGYSPQRDYTDINALRAERRYAEMLPLCEEALKTDPTSLTLLFRTFAGAYNTSGDRKSTLLKNTQTRINQICDAIFASGKGVIEESPFEVVATGDIEQFLTNYLQVDAIEGYSARGPLTVAKVRLSGHPEPVFLYFNVAAPVTQAK